MRPLRLLPVFIALPLAGCISFGTKPPSSLIRLTPAATAPAGETETIAPGRAVTVLVPAAPTELSVTRVPVESGQSRLAYLKDAQWTDVPARLFRDLLAETIRARTGRPTLDANGYHLAPGPRLGGRIDSFGLDADTMKVVLRFDATLQRTENGPIETRRFEAQVPVAAPTAAAVSPALNQAANDVAAQVADWVGR
ncbi:MAG TPA: ABC-type transport auxiliary lipoprotein family protein [Sphingomonas sp.]|nr:ABC-type transport auxiliary lipoprotein family protein [Sphingomonas sp.]